MGLNYYVLVHKKRTVNISLRLPDDSAKMHNKKYDK